MISKHSIQACYLHCVGAVVVIAEPLGVVVPPIVVGGIVVGIVVEALVVAGGIVAGIVALAVADLQGC